MKQQIILIWWGEAVENIFSKKFLKERLEYYQNSYEYNPYEQKKKLKHTLQETLWEDYEVLKFDTPSQDSAVYLEWKVVFEKMIPFMHNGVILIGHSLWGSFLAKYLNENTFPLEISKILLVAPAFWDCEREVLWNFNFDAKLLNFRELSDKITMYYSLDDEIVPISDFENFKEVLWEIKMREFDNRGHFLQEEFPEIVEDIK